MKARSLLTWPGRIAKEALIADGRLPAIVVRGRRGGSAMAAAALNALASAAE